MNTGDVTTEIDPLADLESQLAALEEKREARKKPTVEDRKRALEQKIADQQALAKAEEDHGPEAIATYDTSEGIVIVRRPEAIRYRKYLTVQSQLLGKDTEKANAQLMDEAYKLVLQCLVHPAKPSFDALAEKFPGMPNLVAGKISDLAAGRTREASAK